MGDNWTEERYQEYQQRAARWRKPTVAPAKEEADDGPESKLQAKAERWFRERGYPFFHDKSRGRNTPGWVDLVGALPNRRTVYLEFKARGGRLRPEQERLRLQLMHLGHEWHEVRSYRRFLEIVEGE